MKRILLTLIISIFMLPIIVKAEGCEGITLSEEICTSSESTCKSQFSDSNTWTKTGYTGTTCLKVITKRSNTSNSSEFLSGYDPNDVTCANGNKPTVTFRSAVPARQETLSECSSGACYIRELWEVSCDVSNTGNSTGTGSTGSSSGNSSTGSSSTGNSSSGNSSNSNSGTNSNANVGTNSNGQITGTTESKDTGVETYFIVLISLAAFAYLILIIAKRKNLFKNI